MELRETGKLARDAERQDRPRREAARQLREPGRFTALQGGGWYIEEYGRAQISFNLMNHEITSMHEVFDACCEESEKLGLRVTGSELVGLVPLSAVLAAGDHYLARQGATTAVPEPERIHAAVLSMGLDDLIPFDPAEKIVEYKYRGAPQGLAAMSLSDFTDELSSDSFAPGGGSVAALCGALSCRPLGDGRLLDLGEAGHGGGETSHASRPAARPRSSRAGFSAPSTPTPTPSWE